MWFGTYLRESNAITTDQFLDAMDNYFCNRKPIGQLALEAGLLGLEEVKVILKEQAINASPFGEVAMKLGLLNVSQVEMLVGRQFYSESFWDYMVAQGYLTEESMNEWKLKFRGE